MMVYGIDRAAFNQGVNALYKPQIEEELSATVVSRGPNAVAVIREREREDGQMPETYSMQAIGEYKQTDTASTCKERDYKDATDLVCGEAYGFYPQMKAESITFNKETANCLVNGTNPGFQNGTLDCNSVVRRLTPLECERLQGFPDNWTDIGAWTDSKGKMHKESSDSARYRALGNSISTGPNSFWEFLLKRIAGQYSRRITMGSLFDGIGGFPLIHEQINGKGSCRWASEIEEFCIAVTKYHFGED